MKKRYILFLLIFSFFISACSIQKTSDDQDESSDLINIQEEEVANCGDEGGEMICVWPAPDCKKFCLKPFKDYYKKCYDNNDCESGLCLVDLMKDRQALKEYVESKQGGNCWGFSNSPASCWKTDINGEKGSFLSECNFS